MCIYTYIYNLLFCYLAGLPTANIEPLLWGQPHSPNAPNVNHCVLCLCLSQRVTGSLLMRLGLYAQLNVSWGLNQEA